jgi:hypothetical protein
MPNITDHSVVLNTGYPGHGKDSLGEYLCKKYGYVRVSIAEILKEDCAELFNISMNFFTDNDEKDNVCFYGDFVRECVKNWKEVIECIDSSAWSRGKLVYDAVAVHNEKSLLTPRDLLIMMATFYRSTDDLYFVKQAMKKIRFHLDSGRRVVITDVRYECEPEMIRAEFKDVIHLWIHRTDYTDTSSSDNQSLKPVDCDGCVYNSGSVFDGDRVIKSFIPTKNKDV